MKNVKNFLIVVNSGPDKPYNHYASYVLAFVAKKIMGIENVTIFYGPEGVRMTKKGELAKLTIPDYAKNLIASQIEGLSPSDLPDDLAKLGRFLKEELGVNIYSCGTFNVIDGFASSLDDRSNIEDFITPVSIPQAGEALFGADLIHYL